MSLNLASVHSWCIANKCSLNPAESSFLIIPPKINTRQPFITLNLKNIPLPAYKSVEYLGIYVHEQLGFKCHIEYIEQKIFRAVGILAELKSFSPKPALLKLNYALVHFHLLYGLTIWGFSFSFIPEQTGFTAK